MSLDDRVAVVTGGAQGIGQGVALRLAAAGGRVAVLDRQPATETLAQLRELGRPGWGTEVDMSDAADVARAYARLDSEFGSPYALVNAAGVFADIPFLDTPVEVWDQVMGVNARGVFLSCQEAARRMAAAGGGRIVNILSTASAQGFALESAYCASKGAVLLLTRVLAVELASLGIAVNGVGPGTVETPMGRDYLARGPIAGHELSRTPMGRFGKPADIAETVCFLVSEATWLTGQAIYVDGGFLATGLPLLAEM
jgi:NAD(P)-dependent dehydrogenase (short-subunit alcohol dehydrogenase family)